MEVIAYKMRPKNTYTRTVHGTKNKQYICISDLEKTLRVNRINVRGKRSVKLNVNGKPRRFLHTQHLERIIGRKPSSNTVGRWLAELFLDKTITAPTGSGCPCTHPNTNQERRSAGGGKTYTQ